MNVCVNACWPQKWWPFQKKQWSMQTQRQGTDDGPRLLGRSTSGTGIVVPKQIAFNGFNDDVWSILFWLVLTFLDSIIAPAKYHILFDVDFWVFFFLQVSKWNRCNLERPWWAACREPWGEAWWVGSIFSAQVECSQACFRLRQQHFGNLGMQCLLEAHKTKQKQRLMATDNNWWQTPIVSWIMAIDSNLIRSGGCVASDWSLWRARAVAWHVLFFSF